MATYNVHRCIGGDGRYDPERVAAVLAELQADVLCLQEVSARGEGNGHDQPRLFARRLGYQLITGATLTHGRSEVGNAILTRLPVVDARRLDLSLPRGGEPRGAIVAHLRSDCGDLLLAATHLGLRRWERARQLERLLDEFRDEKGAPVLAGDLNEWRGWGPCSRRLAARFGPAPARRTFPARRPVFRLDRIYAGGALRLHSIDVVRTALTQLASDHLPVRAVLAAATGSRRNESP